MRKYVIFSLLILNLLAPVVSFAGVSLSPVSVNGCPAGALFSATTGQRCPTTFFLGETVTLLSPNGGEKWLKGVYQTIQWKNNTAQNSSYDVAVRAYNSSCTSCGAIYKIAEGITGYSYQWKVGSTKLYNNSPIKEGYYKFLICKVNSDVCDASDKYFKIVSNIPAN